MKINNWKYIDVLEYCTKVTDGTHDSPKPTNEGRCLITSKHIKGRNIDFKSAYLISEQDFYKINQRSRVDQWDVIISMIGEYCGFCYVERNKEINYAVKNVGLFKTGGKIKAEWLYYYLTSRQGKQALSKIKTGSSQPYLTLGALRSLKIPVPTETVIQNKIVSVISTIDSKIEINNKVNMELEDIVKTLYDYWFIQFDFPDESGKPYKSGGGKMVWNDESKREIPEEWKIKNLLNNPLTEIIKPGINNFLGTKNYLATADINEQIVESGNLITFEKRESRANMQPSNNSVWFAKMKASRKHFYIGEYGEDFIKNNILSTGFMGLKCKINAFEYIASYLESDIFELTKDTISHGATMQGIGNDDLKFIKLMIPKEDVLNKYKETVGSTYKKLYLNFVENQKLVELRDWLLPMLMNGQVIIGE